MAARCLLRRTLFPPGLVRCLRYQLFSPSKTFILQAISKAKKSLEPLSWNVNENCDVDVAIDRAGYQSSSTAYVANYNSDKENTIRVELRALLIIEPPSRVRKKVDFPCFFFLGSKKIFRKKYGV